ncbi:MAG: hypothetical protein ABSH26_16620 [Opitutaceae bacterium]|jgi:hypothetical protein
MADEATQPARRPWHVWAVGVVSLLWNSVGAMDFVMTETKNKAYMSGFTPAQLEFYYGFPLWVVAAWGIAVWGGVLGSLLLLLRNRLAVHLFLASFICMIVTSIHNYALSNGLKIMGGAEALAFSAVIVVVGALLLFYARSMCRRGVLS